jgi:ERCC4-type nuclease
MRFTVQDNNLIWDNEILGSTTALYADANEKLVGKNVIGNKQTPHRIDYLMVAGENVVGVESKTVNDLIASWVKGRLQRQLKVLYETVDIPVLMLRGIGGETPYKVLAQYPYLMEDLIKFQLLGTDTSQGLVYPAPFDRAYNSLISLREILSGERKLSSVTTRYEAPPKVKGRGIREQILRNAIDGCGLKMATKLAKIGSLKVILNATPTELKNAGASKPVLAGIARLKK